MDREHTTRFAAVGWVLLATLAACRATPEQPGRSDAPARASGELRPNPLATEPTSSEATLAVRAKMSGHSDDAQVMRRAITIGDVATLRTVASHLASDRWLPSLGAEWAAPLANVRAAAGRATEVTTVEAGAAALAAVATACAACHQTMGGTRRGIALSPPAGEDEPTMLAHQAAVDDLWEGLSTPDSAAWQRGARSLASSPVVGATNPAAERAARTLQDLARRSLDAPSQDREQLLAQSLSTCAQCHRLHGVGGADPGGAAAKE